jgi:hypothetical protein
VTSSPDNAEKITGSRVIFNFTSGILIGLCSIEGRTAPWIYVTSSCQSFLKHYRRACISFSLATFNSSSKAFLHSCKALWNSSTAFQDSSGKSSSFAVMMFLESISDKLPLSSAIVSDESFFVPSGVAKKCGDARPSHTQKHLLMHGLQMSMAGL